MKRTIVRGQNRSSKQVLKTAPPISLRSFHERMDKILIIRQVGGLGDMLMHRMMFEDFKRIDPKIKIVFAVLPCYHCALKDHPFIDELVNSEHIDIANYNTSYNTTSACNRYEVGMSPHSGLHRSDIWANHCGVELRNHEMHLKIDNEAQKFSTDIVDSYRQNHNGPIVLLCPMSAMISKNLTDGQMEGIVTQLRNMNYFVLASHTSSIAILNKLNVPVVKTNTPQLIGLVNACDYIISVDTAQIHIAGGLKKPAVGIFTFADGKVYLKFYSSCELVQKHRDNGDWDCGPCYNYPNCTKYNGLPKPCLTEITVDMIMDKFKELVKRFPHKL